MLGQRGHPGSVFSPYVKQQVGSDGSGSGAVADHNFYTQVNFTRTIEQILGLKPMNQNELVASPMYEIFTRNPPAADFLPWSPGRMSSRWIWARPPNYSFRRRTPRFWLCGQAGEPLPISKSGGGGGEF